jgi:hypothetical protein
MDDSFITDKSFNFDLDEINTLEERIL